MSLSDKEQEQQVNIAVLDTKIDAILVQTKLTNGRVTTLEKWMWGVSGAIAVLAYLISAKLLNI